MNPGFDPAEVRQLQAVLDAKGKSFQYIDEEEISSEMAEFLFIGQHHGQAVIYDCLLGTLRLAYESRLDELAEARTLAKFPDYKGFEFDVDENGNAVQVGEISEEVEDYKAFCMFEIEEAGLADVAESLVVDPEFEFGLGLEVYLNVPEITEEVIARFIADFNAGTLTLDTTKYSFESESDEDE